MLANLSYCAYGCELSALINCWFYLSGSCVLRLVFKQGRFFSDRVD